MNFSIDKKFLLFLLICFFIYFQGILKLPVIDRDEARFATASKTMLINKDFIDIKMVDEVRYKKPIGIYWSQVLSNLVFGSYPYDEIWIYRLPSIIGIFLCMVFVYFIVKRIEKPETALLSVFFLLISFLTISEIHQSKTDGLLFMFISICNLLIYKWINQQEVKKSEIYFFWCAISFGVLIKGPIIFIFIFLPLVIFSIFKKKNYFKFFWSIPAFLVFVIITVPWFILINEKSGGLFWQESIGNDLFNKVKSGQESHGFPPGYYTLLVFIFFWPGSIFIINLVKKIKVNFKKIKEKDELYLYFILSFIVPLMFYEIIPTKLPHYIYPSYLPLAILVAKSIIDSKYNKSLLNYSSLPLIVFPLTMTGLISYSLIEFSEQNHYLILFLILSLIFITILLLIRLKSKVKTLILFTGIFQIANYLVLVFFLIPKLDKIWISEKINKIVSENEEKVDYIFTSGFNEPSLLFLTSHKLDDRKLTKLTNDEINNKRILFIVTDEHYRNIKNTKKIEKLLLIDEFTGFNYSRGREVIFKVFRN